MNLAPLIIIYQVLPFRVPYKFLSFILNKPNFIF